MRVFDFSHAIVREPGQSVVQGLRDDPTAEPNFNGVRREHAAYVSALRAAGVTVDVLPPLEQFPDSVFVEDPALVFAEGAILLRPGAPSRLGEANEMRGALERHFDRVFQLGDGEYADGGDILVMPDTVLIGLSKRTNRAGAEAVRNKLAILGRKVRVVETPKGVLHFKSAVSLLDGGTVLATKAMTDMFSGFEVVLVPEGEEGAANSLRVNDVVFVGEHFVRTIERLRPRYTIVALPVTEIGKLDAGLSCMSLRWNVRS